MGTYHANILKQYVERQSVTSHCLFSMETVAEVDETDEYSLDGCTFPSKRRMESFKDVSISNDLSSEQICESGSLIEQSPDVLTSLLGRMDVICDIIKLRYPISYKTREVIETRIQEMLDLGVIEMSVSPYFSPILLVPK